MKALRWHAQRDVRLEDIPEPFPGPSQVKVKVKWCGFCGSDIHEYEAGPFLIPTTKPHPIPGSKMAPIVPGHEFSGLVVEIGENVTGIKIGDRVVVRPTMPCYKCYWCKKGKHIQCSTLGSIGFMWDGGFAEYAVLPSDCIYKIPEKLSFEVASLTEPLACAVHAVRRADIHPGDSVAVIGAGPIGLLVMLVAKACGALPVYVIETLPKRGKLALELGAEAVFNPNEADVGKEIAKVTDGRRVDVAFECAGPPAAMLTAQKVSGKGGKIVEVGQMMEGTCAFPFWNLFLQEKTIVTSQGYTEEFPIALSFLSERKVNLESLITARIKLDNIISQGYEILSGNFKFDHTKIIVTPE